MGDKPPIQWINEQVRRMGVKDLSSTMRDAVASTHIITSITFAYAPMMKNKWGVMVDMESQRYRTGEGATPEEALECAMSDDQLSDDRHVAPAEPVVLTQSEWDDLYFQLRENEMKPTGVVRWFQDNGFRLVRTGVADDGA